MPTRTPDLTTREGRQRYRDAMQYLQDQALAANICRLIDMLNDMEQSRNHWCKLAEHWLRRTLKAERIQDIANQEAEDAA